MGHGSYKSADWSKHKSSRRITESSRTDNIFEKHKLDPKFDPKFIGFRESRDSDDHPDSTPIILGLDVTGSMGYLATEIAKNGLHETMMKLFSLKPVNDPQLMFAALGDRIDSAPLQVTQYESDIRIAQQLLELWLEMGGGDAPEDYQLLWYFAAKHTVTDRFEKRGKKGFIFTIGDADCHESITPDVVKKVFGEESKELSLEETVKMASEKYELFHIHIVKSNDILPHNLKKALPGRCLRIKKDLINTLPELIVSVLMLFGGKTLDEVLESWPEKTAELIKWSLKGLVVSTDDGVSF